MKKLSNHTTIQIEDLWLDGRRKGQIAYGKECQAASTIRLTSVFKMVVFLFTTMSKFD